jgi:hypothetical protein
LKSYTERLIELGHSPDLGETWYAATKRRWHQHRLACESQGCSDLREPFETFAREIVTAETDEIRVSLLTPEPMAKPQPPFRQYKQYVPPVHLAA